MIDLHSWRIGDRVTMRYPNGILQEALLVGNDAGMLKFQFGALVRDCVGPIVDIFLNGSGECLPAKQERNYSNAMHICTVGGDCRPSCWASAHA